MATGGMGTSGKTLKINIVPNLDIDALVRQINEAMARASAGATTPGPPTGPPLPGPPADDKSTDKEDKSTDKVKDGKSSDKGGKTSDSDTHATPKTTGGCGDGKEKNKTKDSVVAAVKTVGRVLKQVVSMSQTVFKGIFGIVQDIHSRVKQSSQFLAAVENMFNLAMTLLLMPLGNALAEVILPATMELVDSVVGLWDEFDKFAGNGDLAGIIGVVLDKGIKIFGNYFNDIGNIFSNTGNNLLDGVGELFKWVGNLLESGTATKLLNMLFDLFRFFTENFTAFVSMFAGLMTAQIGATIGGAINPAGAAAGAATGVVAGALITGAAVSGALASADGQYFPATAGGTTVRVAEGGEGEYVIPESKIGETGGGRNVIVNFYGYNTDEMVDKVRQVLSDEVSGARYRQGVI